MISSESQHSGKRTSSPMAQGAPSQVLSPSSAFKSPVMAYLPPLTSGAVPFDVKRRMTTAGYDEATFAKLLADSRRSGVTATESSPHHDKNTQKVSEQDRYNSYIPQITPYSPHYTGVKSPTQNRAADYAQLVGKKAFSVEDLDVPKAHRTTGTLELPQSPIREKAHEGQGKDNKEKAADYRVMLDEDVVVAVSEKKILSYELEEKLGDLERAVKIRRMVMAQHIGNDCFEGVPYKDYAYDKVFRQCCENVVGYIPIPLGLAGPLLLNGESFRIPMATTEGSLVASTSRGCKAISKSGGATSFILKDGMARAPIVRFPTAQRSCHVANWIEKPENATSLKTAFDSTSQFLRLRSVRAHQAGRNLYIRFVAHCGDAMGMNMISKGCGRALQLLELRFNDMEVVSLSGNLCTDKKPSAMNWIEGRGKSVIAETVISKHIVKTVLKTSVEHLIDLNIQKNLVGSALAGSIGGMNSHAANLVAAVYLACGQDPAQVVEGSHCMTLMESTTEGHLYMSVTMPAVEVGTVGGGTILEAQESCLRMLDVNGPHATNPGSNARKLAMIVGGTVLAGELSLASALAAGHLLTAHMKHNRSSSSLSNMDVAEVGMGQRHAAMSVMSYASEDAEHQVL